jgi:hypothetical protein
MSNPELEPAPFVEINAIFRKRSLAKLEKDAAVEPERYARARAKAEEEARYIQLHAAYLAPDEADIDQLKDAFTKIFFRFSNPHDPADGVAEEQLAWLRLPPDEEPCPKYSQCLDTLASYLYAYGGEAFLGEWSEGVTSEQRFYEATRRISEDLSGS